MKFRRGKGGKSGTLINSWRLWQEWGVVFGCSDNACGKEKLPARPRRGLREGNQLESRGGGTPKACCNPAWNAACAATQQIENDKASQIKSLLDRLIWVFKGKRLPSRRCFWPWASSWAWSALARWTWTEGRSMFQMPGSTAGSTLRTSRRMNHQGGRGALASAVSRVFACWEVGEKERWRRWVG